MNGRNEWKGIHLRMKFDIFRSVFTAIQESGVRVFVEGINYSRLKASANVKKSPRERAESHLLEQINHYRTPRNRLKVYIDNHHTKENSRSNLAEYKNRGTYGYKPNQLQNLSDELYFIESKENRVLQAADMVTYIYNRLITIEERYEKAQKFKQELWASLKHDISKPASGRGRVWPQDAQNPR